MRPAASDVFEASAMSPPLSSANAATVEADHCVAGRCAGATAGPCGMRRRFRGTKDSSLLLGGMGPPGTTEHRAEGKSGSGWTIHPLDPPLLLRAAPAFREVD